MDIRAQSTNEIIPDWVRDEIEQRIRTGMLELPLLPAIAAEALELCQSPDADAHHLAQILQRDQSIAGNVLRVVNSPLFGAPVRITSLQQAVSRTGIRVITEIVLSVAMKATVFAVPAIWRGAVGDVGRLSLVSALYAKEIAQATGSDADTAFLMGLLHDMGAPVLLLILEKLEKKRRRSIELIAVKAVVGAYHAEVGAHLARHWRLADEIVAAIDHHEDWASMDDAAEGAPLVSLAAALAHVAIPDRAETVNSVLAHPALAALHLDREQAETLLDMGEHILQMADLAG